MDNMIEIAANLLLSNAISIYDVGYKIHIRTPIAPYSLPQPISTFQEYLIVLKSSDSCVPSMLYVPDNQVFFCVKLSVCPESNQLTITVEEYSWTVHQGSGCKWAGLGPKVAFRTRPAWKGGLGRAGSN
jgi:hypothetical protein